MKTDWDYSYRAYTYDKRADYSVMAVKEAIKLTGLSFDTSVADVGAGTGKLTKLLSKEFSRVYAVEPNDNMRSYGQVNVPTSHVAWSKGSAEVTGLGSDSVSAVYFGSSFNVVDPNLTISEILRITKNDGWFTCMWNHRDTEDAMQSEIERIIRSWVPNYQYGIRRQDPTGFLDSTGVFKEVNFIEKRFEVSMSKEDTVDAWKSHQTLFRQSRDMFDDVIRAIEGLIPEVGIVVPYFTRIWVTQLK